MKTEYLADILEEKVRSRGNNSAIGAQIFKEAGCIYNDERSIEIVQSVVGYLTRKLHQNDGEMGLTACSAAVGGIVLATFGREETKANAIKLGDFVLGMFLDYNLLLLKREDYRTTTEITEWIKTPPGSKKEWKRVKKEFKTNPYTIRYGPEFKRLEMVRMDRPGMSLSKFPKWNRGMRNVNGTTQKLIKSQAVVTDEHKHEPFMVAVEFLENVRWNIDEGVAKVSHDMWDVLTDSRIELTDDWGNIVMFQTDDMDRTADNSEWLDKDLFREGKLFEPHLGSVSYVKELEKDLKRLNNNLKNSKKLSTKDRLKEEIRILTTIYNKVNRLWLDKQECLKVSSKSARNRAILKTIHGDSSSIGWAGYAFYLAHFLDYRGRTYCRDSYFSFQSNDLAKGHFQFAEKKTITERGVYWTYIHCANSFSQSYLVDELESWMEYDYRLYLETEELTDISVDKMTLDDRVHWVEENIVEILEVADDPLGTTDYWMSADKPWTFLQMCLEIQGILCDPDHESGIIIPVDGAQNGTQHLCGMSKDGEAGAMVALTPTEIPTDFYIKTLKGILKKIEGTELGKKLGDYPMKKLRDAIAKRGTMTKAYDAGVRCIAEIILNDSYDKGVDINKDEAKVLAQFLVETYEELCTGPVLIKDYLQGLVSYRLTELDCNEVSWTTPTGFPVLTHKFVEYNKKVRGHLSGKPIYHVYKDVRDIPLLAEHQSAIGANFIHSYDASHMGLVINEWKARGYRSFACVHDSFGVHASDVEELLYVIKDEFVKMYEKDIFQHMEDDLVWGQEVPGLSRPELGDLDLSEVYDSDYFFC